jgi:hypothetical protein
VNACSRVSRESSVFAFCLIEVERVRSNSNERESRCTHFGRREERSVNGERTSFSFDRTEFECKDSILDEDDNRESPYDTARNETV